MPIQHPSPLLSLIVPHYNMLDTLPRLLESVRIQSLRSLEIVLVDDGSAQSCRELVSAYQNSGLNMRLVEHCRNLGSKQACITGVENARGSLLAIASADDFLWGSNALEHPARLLLREGADMVHCNTLRRDQETGEEDLWTWAAPFAPALDGHALFTAYVEQNMRGHSLSDKVYTKALWSQCMDAARAGNIHFEGEDCFLASLLFAHTRIYRGSDHIMHYYFMTSKANRYARAPQYIVNFHKMLESIYPHLSSACVSPKNIERYSTCMGKSQRWRINLLSEVLFDRNGFPAHAEAFSRLVCHVDPEELTKAVHHALYRVHTLPPALEKQKRLLRYLENHPQRACSSFGLPPFSVVHSRT